MRYEQLEQRSRSEERRVGKECKLGSPTLAPPDDHAQDIPARHSTRVRSTPAHLLDYHCYTARASNLS